MNKPLVSVIMPTFNTKEEYLREAIESILNQTYSNFEFIIIDDGSVNNDLAIALSYMDDRIRTFKNDQNMGLPATLNKAIALSKGDYIVRMDSDDISLPLRLETLVSFMEKHNEIDIAGSAKIDFGTKHTTDRKKVSDGQHGELSRFIFYKSLLKKQTFIEKYYRNTVYINPEENEDIRCCMLFRCPFVHPSIIFRKASIQKYNIQYTEDQKAEDYNLWVECSFNKRIQFANLTEPLIKYRNHDNQITVKSKELMTNSCRGIYEKIFKILQIEISPQEFDTYVSFSTGSSALSKDELIRVENIYLQIVDANKAVDMYEESTLRKVLANKFATECIRQCRNYGNYNGSIYTSFKLKKFSKLPLHYKVILSLLRIGYLFQKREK